MYDVPGPYRCIRCITRAWKNRLYRLPPKKDYHVYITRSIYHYAYIRATDASRLEKRNKEKGKEMGAWGQEKEEKVFWGGLLASLPPEERDVTWFFDGLQQYYERLPIHPPKHGLTANYAIDS